MKATGYDSNPLAAMNQDLVIDDQRRMVFLGVVLAGAVLSTVIGIILRRNLQRGKRNEE